MDSKKKLKHEVPDFAHLKDVYENLPTGPRTEIKRARTLDEIRKLPSFYRWASKDPVAAKCLHNEYSIKNIQRAAFFIAHGQHDLKSPTLGKLFAEAGVSDLRVYQMVKSSAPRDIQHLKNLIRITSSKTKSFKLNWQEFGRILYNWTVPWAYHKENMLRDFVLNSEGRKNDQ